MRMPSSLTGWDLVCVAKFRLEREFVEIGTFSSPVSFQPVATVHYFPCKRLSMDITSNQINHL